MSTEACEAYGDSKRPNWDVLKFDKQEPRQGLEMKINSIQIGRVMMCYMDLNGALASMKRESR